MIRRHLIFHGRVQGVGFRYYSVQKARSLGLTGWVENLDDGTVEMEVQGKAEEISELIVYLEGRNWVEIDWIDEEQLPVIPERDFRERWE